MSPSDQIAPPTDNINLSLTPPISPSENVHIQGFQAADKSSISPKNGSITPASPPSGLPPSASTAPTAPTLTRKLTMSSRITGIFKKDPEKIAKEKEKEKSQTASSGIASGKTSGSSSRQLATPPSGAIEKLSFTERKIPQDEYGNYKRYWINDDASHEHFLRVAKRQQKLKDLMRGFFEKKKQPNPDDQPLTLINDWMHEQKNGDRADLNNGSTTSQTLVEKYGKCQEVVGHGAFGIVRVAHKPDPKDSRREQLYAVKEFHRRPNESAKKYQKRLTSEFCLSSSMEHPNVIQTLELLQDDKGDYCEVMEYCAGGDLYTLVLTAGTLEVGEADCYFKQLMRGVEYMHEMGVAHRDLKPENLLLTSRGTLKITDFGNGECFRMAWEKEAHMTAGLCGSAPYIAPEEYVDKEFDPRAVDVWACGVIYMAMRTGRHLWRVAQKVEDEFFSRYLEDRKEESGFRPIEMLRRRQCRNVIYSILDPSPTRRLTATEILQSEWVRDIQICKAGEQGH